MIKLSSSLLLISLFFIWSTLIVTINCENYKAIYTNPLRSSSIIYGIFKTSPDSSTNLTESIVDCNFVNHPTIVNQILTSFGGEVKRLMKTIKNVDTFDALADHCISINLTTAQSSLSVNPRKFTIFGISSDMLIAPGTKWCGPGNRSMSYDDLGDAIETDKCCRDHDHCALSIRPGCSKYNLTNKTPYTISHCDCDEHFKDCLKEASKTDFGASLLGVIYFNLIKFKCFHEMIPKGECLEYSELPYSGRCIRYADSDATEAVFAFRDSNGYKL